jgi:Mrr N-terminal domain
MALTPARILRERILRTLSAGHLNGRSRAEILRALDETYHQEWSTEDLATPRTRPFEPKWANRASYERARMVREGLLTGDANGSWTLTEAGRRAAGTLDWDLYPGDTLSRQERVGRFGGGRYGGIEPSRSTPNVFLYSDPSAGSEYGYDYDGWSTDGGVFLYTGEGRQGDQQMVNGNLALLHHASDGRALRLFVADGAEQGSSTKIQRYVGQFILDDETPFVRAEALDSAKLLRTVFVFRLRPHGEILFRETDRSRTGDARLAVEAELQLIAGVPSEAVAASVPVEQAMTGEYATSGHASIVAIRREADLVERFREWLVDRSHSVSRFRIRPPGELRDLFSDIFDHSDNILYEAKAAATRDAVRMAIGQLLDYRRYVPGNPQLVVLLPARPTDDLLTLLSGLGIGCVWATGRTTFAGTS